MSISIAVIGECMLELTHAQANEGSADSKQGEQGPSAALPLGMSYGGDTINTSIYLSRNGVDVSYVTGLGDDIMSDWLIEEWSKEGIDCSLVTRMENTVPGMYMINVDDQGERSFLYWCKNSPASRIFDEAASAEKLFESISSYEYLYLSGISLAILETESCDRLISLLEKYRQNGGKLIFDGNYRPKLWSSVAEAKRTYTQIYKITDIALPTLEDEAMLFGFESAEQVMQAIRDHGVPEVVVKMGGEGCLTLHEDAPKFITTEMIEPVDTTAAGDSFNAGYLAARLKGSTKIDACYAGHALAGKVIQHRGAIIPQSAA